MDFTSSNFDPYELLGVPFGASFDVCKSTYKSLAKIDHPDIFAGDSNFAERRMSELNAAYEFLSDPRRKMQFDSQGQRSEQKEKRQEYTPEHDDEEFTEAERILKETWDFVCEYHPTLEILYRNLKRLSSHTAFLFKAAIVEQKLYHQAAELAKYLEDEFLNSKFGDNQETKDLAKFAIFSGEIQFAQQLNKALKIMGSESIELIYKKLEQDYPKFAPIAFEQIGRSVSLKSSSRASDYASNKRVYVKHYKGFPIYKFYGTRIMIVEDKSFEGILAAEAYIDRTYF